LLDNITPLILTYNEAPNIGRTLKRLRWAREVVLVDSYSTDETLEIASGFPNVRVVQRSFDSHAEQWNFGLRDTAIVTEWVLALDADYVLTPQLTEELKTLNPGAETKGYRAPFDYCIRGQRLRSGIYPPATVLYRRQDASYYQDGHTQKILLKGSVENLKSAILHDDRKELKRWFQSQLVYAQLEADKLRQKPVAALSLTDRLRRWRVLAPLMTAVYCLLIRGGILMVELASTMHSSGRWRN
jgi:glycosyltransferase involved in cell wall biosynthesis